MTKKKTRLSRKQIKQRQQAQKAHIRRQRGWNPPPQGQTKPLSPEENQALAALMSGGETATMESISKILFNSGEWIDEPEFADIFFSPLESMETFVSEMEKRGYSPQSFAELDQDAQDDNGLSILDVVENLPAEVEKSAGKLLKRIPGLRSFLEKQTDKVWDEGLDAVYTGDLYLELFTEDELNGAVQIMQNLATIVKSGTQFDKIPNKQLTSFVHQMDEYIVGLMTPTRLTRLQTRIREILQKELVDRHWLPFVVMLKGYFQEDDAVEQERPFIIRAIMGELNIMVKQAVAATDEEE